MGVGWYQYQNDPTFVTSQYYRYVLHHEIIHSVRDSYTEHKMNKMGFRNAVNTGCPTTWNLTKDLCNAIPTTRSNSVLFTLTDYKPNSRHDIPLLDLLHREYENVYFWPQGYADIAYIKELLEKVEI